MAAENSFDIVCKIDMQEVTNALDQARREIETRYDLKGTKNEIKLEKTDITLLAADEMKLKAVTDILQSKLHKRGIPLKGLTYGTVEQAAGNQLRQKITLQQGIPIDKAKEIVRLIKDSKVKVQASINEDKVRVAGKDALRTIAAFRLAMPRTVLRYAGGRELTLGEPAAVSGGTLTLVDVRPGKRAPGTIPSRDYQFTFTFQRR